MIPVRSEIKAAIIQVLADNGPLTSKDVYRRLSIQFSLNKNDLDKVTLQNEPYFEKEVRWAKKDLVDNRTIQRPNESGRGIWQLVNASSAS